MITLEQTIDSMKKEIVTDVLDGRVPDNVKSFGDLHDYVDANEYGGLREDEHCDALIEQFGGRDAINEMPEGMIGFINAAHGMVDVWLRNGGISGALRAHHRSAPPALRVDQLRAECHRWAHRYQVLMQENAVLRARVGNLSRRSTTGAAGAEPATKPAPLLGQFTGVQT